MEMGFVFVLVLVGGMGCRLSLGGRFLRDEGGMKVGV